MDERQFRAQEALILGQQPRVVAAPISNELLTLYKTVAEQVTAAGPLFLGNLLVLQNVGQATQLLGVQSAADFAHDYGIEWAWNTYGPQRLREEPFEMLLTDIVMPEMDGIELARRASELDPDIKIMFITGFAAVALNSDSEAPKNAKVLAKPVHLRELVNEVNKMLAA